jgi:hypothetical protein
MRAQGSQPTTADGQTLAGNAHRALVLEQGLVLRDVDAALVQQPVYALLRAHEQNRENTSNERASTIVASSNGEKESKRMDGMTLTLKTEDTGNGVFASSSWD